ncbi:hypothetical protein [Salinispora pacifica]|uniref:hypothetical protein n=1 Tax=Salinispora pacifica TaxID=351187 RepID=UPI000371C7BD|nr:hypothetical protein [Salinispora pacifica]
MSRTIRKKHLLAGLAAAGVLGVGVAAPAVAADNTSPSPSASAVAEKGADKEQQRSDRQAAFAEALAEKLGVDVNKVTTALEELREQRAADRPDRPERGERPERPERPERGERPDAADRQEALAQRLAQAVEEGTLTQEQADAITAAAEAGILRGPGGPGGHDDSVGK